MSALLDDLADRGLLESTLVVVTGDMGRSPRVNGKAGRDHWPQCGFALFAGGGTRPGVVHGVTDKIAAFPTDHPVSAGDLVATVYHLVGVDPEGTVPDHTGRPTHISHGGRPVAGVLK
jgi:arylsulfatase A-like enzyme